MAALRSLYLKKFEKQLWNFIRDKIPKDIAQTPTIAR
jgi:hypothetical protein